MRGAKVIGTASTPKLEVARAAGCDHVIDYTAQDFVAETRRITANRGVDVVYDSVGQTTFMKSLDCIRPRGMMVSFGQSSGPVENFSPLILNQKGSLFLTRPSLGHHCLTRDELLWRATDVLNWMGEGKLSMLVERTYPMAEAAQAHRDLEGRKTTGKLLLRP
jgi:NADPH:quinone reductase